MSRKQKEPLRPLTGPEREQLQQIARAQAWPAAQVARAKALLAVAQGSSYVQAARAVGRKSGDAVSRLVARFNQEGVPSIIPIHGGGPQPLYGPDQREFILAQARRSPDREQDGTAAWSLTCLQRALHRELPDISTYTIWCVLHEAGLSWQKSRTWCQTGQAQRQRKNGPVTVTDPDAEAKKKLIEEAYLRGERQGLIVCNEDEAGPFQSLPQPGSSWQPMEHCARQPHEYIRGGTAKLLTLFHPASGQAASGQVRVKGVTRSGNAVLHPWLEQQLTEVLNAFPLPSQEGQAEEGRHRQWSHWQSGLTEKFTLAAHLPPLFTPLQPLWAEGRMLLVLDNLAGHKTPAFVCWLMAHGVMPLYTPVGGSWLNMAESIQRILVRRALWGQHPSGPEEIMDWLEATARAWNREPTPFVWGGRRQARRERAYRRRHPLGGSSACTLRPVKRARTKGYEHDK